MTKKQAVLEHLKKYKTITPLEALRDYGSMNLGIIIFDLRKQYKIKTNFVAIQTKLGNTTITQYEYGGKL